MTPNSRVTLRPGAAALAALTVFAAGGGAAVLLMRQAGPAADRPPAPAATPLPDAPHAAQTHSRTSHPAAAPGAPMPDVAIALPAEMVARAGIVVGPVEASPVAPVIRLPGVVEPNAYRQVQVTPLVAGRVTRVLVQLGDRVRRGQTMAEIYSPELAEAQMRYLSLRARLDAHARELQRTEKLAGIGAASRQELERVGADHVAQTAELETARSRLELLGMPAAAIDRLQGAASVRATTVVPAPIDGVVLERQANAGLNVDPSMPLFSVVDLSSVWIVADLYERDFASVEVGAEATVETTAYPDRPLRGRVSYIDPQLSPATRTARIRVEVPNPGGGLRLGMYADVRLEAGTGAASPVVPAAAVQKVGDRDVVYLADPHEPGTFIEREVRLGRSAGDAYEVRSGVRPGDRVVVEGSFFLRAERERLGLRRPAGPGPAPGFGSGPAEEMPPVEVLVTERGYQPSTVPVRAGAAVRIAFLRTTDETCGTEVVVPSLEIRRALPLNERVVVSVTAPLDGQIAFVCGMDMLRGVLVADPSAS